MGSVLVVPRLLATHLIWGCYGFWLPNDPRGSWSKYVGSRLIYDAGGKATTVSTRRSLAKDPHDRERRQATKAALLDPPVRLSGGAAREVAHAIADAAAYRGVAVLALAVMPDHVHAVVGRSELSPFELIETFKSRATRRLNECELAPRPGKKPWVRGGWNVMLCNDSEVERAVRYVEENPVRDGLRRQRWSCVEPWVRAD